MPVNWKWMGNKVSKAIRDELDEILLKTANVVENKAKMYCPVMGGKYARGLPKKQVKQKQWKVREPGALRDSITARKSKYKKGGYIVRAGGVKVRNTIVYYGSWVELGTHKMQARPFLRRATKEAQPVFLNSLTRIDKLKVPEIPDEIATYYEGI